MDGITRDKVSFLDRWRSRQFPLAHCVIESLAHGPHEDLLATWFPSTAFETWPVLHTQMRWEPTNWCRNLCFWKMYWFSWALRFRGWGVDWTLECSYFRDTLHSSKRDSFILLINIKTQQTTSFSLIITTWDKKQGRNFLRTETCSTVLSHGACETLGREAVSFDAFF